MFDFAQNILAKWLDSFKTANPKIWGFIAIALTAIMAVLQSGVDLGLWTETPLYAKIVQALGWLTALLLGSRTYQFLPAEKQKAVDEATGFIQ